MATLVLTTVGTLVGGPIGGLIGAVVGQQVDQRLFAPRRTGPRLGELAVQVSRYGQPVPRLYGRLRVAGSVIWATDLVEDVHRSGGGKGKPKTTSYSYSVSFAVALSARPIRAVHRIWADGKLLRGAVGDWKSETGAFRIYLGDEGQPVDPLIAAAEGTGGTPAYRGMAYCVFEHLQLADFANHIPSLSFEVEADAAAVTLGAVARDLSQGEVDGDEAGGAALALGGYAAAGDSVRGAIEAVGRVAGLSLADDGTRLAFADPEAAPVVLDALGSPVLAATRRAAGVLPDCVELGYYEPERDFQTGLQRARRGGPGRRVEAIDLPAALPADAAKALAEQRLATLWAERCERTVRLPWRRLDLRPGQVVTLPDAAGTWRVRELRIETDRVEARLVPVLAMDGALPPAAPGRPVEAPDAVQGPTRVELLDLPPLDDGAVGMARLWVAAAGTLPGWHGAALALSSDGGASFEAAGSTAAPATMGQALGVLGAGSATLFDMAHSIEVELLHDGMALAGQSDAALANGGNLALLGDELIQFGLAEAIGPRRWRLSRLLRGRRGTEWAQGLHIDGERFVMIEAGRLAALDLPAGLIGAPVELLASGVGDATAAEAALTLEGRALRPPAPVRLLADLMGDGAIRFGWTRRSRTGWAWLDGSDAPLGEESERYRVEIAPSAGTARVVEVMIAGFDYTLAMQVADGSAGAGAMTLSVCQLGTIAPSRTASATFAF